MIRKSLSIMGILIAAILLNGCIKVVSTDPTDGVTGIACNTPIKVTFNMPARPASVNADTFIVKDSLNNTVEGTVSYSQKVATFTPKGNLAALMRYTITMTAGIKDVLGIPMGTAYNFSFTTKEESTYPPGTSIGAVKYSEAATITLYKDDGSGLVPIPNGTVVSGGTNLRLGVKVVGGAYSGGRVFFSNGAGYQVEAIQQGEYYACDFMVDGDQLLAPILVQVIYPHGLASKEKFVLRTHLGARGDQLVRDGMGILIGKDILATADGMDLVGITVSSMEPASAVYRALGSILRVNNLLNIGIQDGISEGTTEPVSPVFKLVIGGLIPVIKDVENFTLQDLFAYSVGEFLAADASGLDLERKTAFLDMYGLPAATTDDVVAMGMGLFVAKDATTFPQGVTLYPNNGNTHPPLVMDAENDLGSSDKAKCLGINMSMDNMSQFLAAFLEGYLSFDAANLPIPLAIPSSSNGKLHVTFNKAGVAFDFRLGTPLLILNDMRMEYLDASVPQWQMSLDMAFTLAVGTHKAIATDPDTGQSSEHSYLDIYLTQIPEWSHCHVMKDDLGISLFDHSAFAVLIVEALKAILPADNGADLMFSIDMQTYGFSLSAASATSSAGRCFLKMVTDDADLEKAAACFISTAARD